MKISVVLNTYNAEKHLGKVLNSVKEFDEIVVCDMHSTDNTLKIAEKFGANIVFHENTGYVEPARNVAIQSAKNEWVLLLDADEIPSENLKKKLLEVAQENRYSAVKIPFTNYFMGKKMRSAYPDYHTRFFKKHNAFWPPEIHSKLQIEGEILTLLKSQTDLAIDHIADDSVKTILNKNNIYSDAELKKRAGKKVGFGKLMFSPFFWFLKYYFIKLGCLDGKKGFIFACLKAQYKFATLAKLYENTQPSK